MKEKNIKFILELIFIFILPLCLLATCFKQEKVYDENNNEIGKYLTFDNIFILSEEQVTYYNYEYYAHDEVLYLEANSPLYVNFNVSPFIQNGSNSSTFNSVLYYNYNGYHRFMIPNAQGYISSSGSADYESVTYNEYNVTYIRFNQGLYYKNHYDNYIKHINSYTIGNNVINRLLNSLYDSLGITSNWILQFIVIYTLLWLIMWFIWHILYLPLDFICSKLLFDRVDK